MDCVLLRHGIAVERDEWEGLDGDRPLTERGAKRVAQVADGLNRINVQPTHILSSPLIRAIETAKIARRSLRARSAIHIVDELLPDAPPHRLVTILHNLPPESCVLCIGHEPQLGMAASVLLSGRVSASFSLKKAGACLIELSTPTKPGQGVLRWWLTPGQLRVLGKRQQP
ncbi:MAG TPA: histidine phosphatase family protein [Nitrospiraceae bacterium]|nr:histidine phosphatase family protein [Nitrospiraceae bacterium]